jgi:hypothetical protein
MIAEDPLCRLALKKEPVKALDMHGTRILVIYPMWSGKGSARPRDLFFPARGA